MMRRLRRLALLCCLLPGLAFAAPAKPALRDLVLASGEETQRSADGVWLSLLYTELFERLGYRLVIVEYPLARGAALAETGAVDGLLQRAAFYQDVAPNLIQVPEPHFSTRFVAYAARPMPLLNGWASLNDGAWRVECRRGIALCEFRARQAVGEDLLSLVNNTELGLRKLIHGRTDLFIDMTHAVEGQLEKEEFRHAGVRVAGVMDEQSMHIYLTRQHRALVPRIAELLRQMKDEGLVEKYRIQAGRR